MANPKNLVIVESPAKAKTIGKYLGPGYQVKACMGHLRDLPKSTLGVDIEDNFSPIETAYPNDGTVTVTAKGAAKLAIRIPAWCDSFTVNKSYTMQNGYAVVENDGTPVIVTFDLTPRKVWADARVLRTANQAAVMKGPIVYCAEGVDNGEGELYHYILPDDFDATEEQNAEYGLPTLTVPCVKRVNDDGSLYRNTAPKTEKATLRLIPYNAFANRAETDMRVWFFTK